MFIPAIFCVSLTYIFPGCSKYFTGRTQRVVHVSRILFTRPHFIECGVGLTLSVVLIKSYSWAPWSSLFGTAFLVVAYVLWHVWPFLERVLRDGERAAEVCSREAFLEKEEFVAAQRGIQEHVLVCGQEEEAALQQRLAGIDDEVDVGEVDDRYTIVLAQRNEAERLLAERERMLKVWEGRRERERCSPCSFFDVICGEVCFVRGDRDTPLMTGYFQERVERMREWRGRLEEGAIDSPTRSRFMELIAAGERLLLQRLDAGSQRGVGSRAEAEANRLRRLKGVYGECATICDQIGRDREGIERIKEFCIRECKKLEALQGLFRGRRTGR